MDGKLLNPGTEDDRPIGCKYWQQRRLSNIDALIYQWHKYEETGVIDNFRIVAGIKKGVRKGLFFFDCDLHKWAEATALCLNNHSNTELRENLSEYIRLVTAAQAEDGYLFTYNQFYFPNTRWKNLLYEHELFVLGTFIDTCITVNKIFPDEKLLELGLKTADLICKEFDGTGPEKTSGHEGIEYSLLCLYETTGDQRYFDCAQNFIEQRGRNRFFPIQAGVGLISTVLRSMWVSVIERTRGDKSAKPKEMLTIRKTFDLNDKENLPLLFINALQNILSGKYFQQHLPVRQQITPEGHSVRWVYFMTACAKLLSHKEDASLKNMMEQSWQKMVNHRMYITGGVGQVPIVEGFGADDDLPDESAYCETCAAIGNFRLNWELAKTTKHARYADLMDWLLHNAIAVGMSFDGKGYYYRNLLSSIDGDGRKDWFQVPCCPTNISKLFADIENFTMSTDKNDLWIHQYWGGSSKFDLENCSGAIKNKSNWPWSGKGRINLSFDKPVSITIHLRVPGWADKPEVIVNGTPVVLDTLKGEKASNQFERSYYVAITRNWDKSNDIQYNWDMPVIFHKRQKRNAEYALSKGPLLYCVEGKDAQIPPEKVNIDFKQSIVEQTIQFNDQEITTLTANDQTDAPVAFVPYHFIGNRGKTPMSVWIRGKD